MTGHPPAPSVSDATSSTFVGPAAAGPDWRSGPEIVGRDSDLASLSTALDDVAAGSGRTVLISGTPGVGKSALLRRFLRRLGPGHIQAAAECLELEATESLCPFTTLIAALARSHPHAHEDAARISTLMGETRALDPDAQRGRVAVAWAGLLANLSRHDPIVIAIDDLHWADGLSLELFAYLARKLVGSRVLLIGTYRPTEGDPDGALARLSVDLERRGAIHQRLGPLTIDGTAQLVRTILRLDRPAARDFVELIHARTEGIPLLVEELLRTLAADGRLIRRDGGWHSTYGLTDDVAPPSIAATVRAQLARLDVTSRRTLRAAAVLGQRFELDLLERMSGTSPARIREAMEDGIAAGLVEADAATGFRFRHALIRDALEATLIAPERSALHRSAASALAGRGSPARLAHHHERAGDRDRASEQHQAAAFAALQTASYGEALWHAERVLDLAVASGDFFIRMMPAVNEWGDAERALGFVQRARALYLAQGDLLHAGRCLAWSGTFADSSESGARVQMEAIAELEPFGDTHHLANALQNLSQTQAPLTAYELAQRSLSVARRLNATREVIRGLVAVGHALARAGRTDDALAYLRDAVRTIHGASSEEVAHAVVVNMLYVTASAMRMIPGTRDERQEIVRQLITFGTDQGMQSVLLSEALHEVALAAADWDACLELADQRSTFNTRTPLEALSRVREHHLRLLRSGPGDADAVAFELTHGPASPPPQDLLRRLIDRGHAGVSAWMCASAVALDDPSRACATAAPLHAHLDGNFSNVAGIYALAAARMLDDRTGFERWSADPPGDVPRDAPAVRARLAFANGERAAANGEVSTAIDTLGRSADLLAEFGEPILERFVRLRRVEIRAHAGQAERAQEELDEIVAYWRRARATWHLGRIRDRLAPFGLAVEPLEEPSSGPRTRATLTRREIEVASLVADGLTNRDIATRLGVSPRTAESHVESIRAKLGFTSRAQIAAWVAQRSGVR